MQTMDGLTDRKTEETVRYHAGVRLLCGVDGTAETIDHTSIEDFRNTVGPEVAEELNKIIVRYAVKEGFTGSKTCSSDTTVQEAPIQQAAGEVGGSVYHKGADGNVGYQSKQIAQGFERRCSDSGGRVTEEEINREATGDGDREKTFGSSEKENRDPKNVFLKHYFPNFN